MELKDVIAKWDGELSKAEDHLPNVQTNNTAKVATEARVATLKEVLGDLNALQESWNHGDEKGS